MRHHQQYKVGKGQDLNKPSNKPNNKPNNKNILPPSRQPPPPQPNTFQLKQLDNEFPSLIKSNSKLISQPTPSSPSPSPPPPVLNYKNTTNENKIINNNNEPTKNNNDGGLNVIHKKSPIHFNHFIHLWDKRRKQYILLYGIDLYERTFMFPDKYNTINMRLNENYKEGEDYFNQFIIEELDEDIDNDIDEDIEIYSDCSYTDGDDDKYFEYGWR